MTVFWLTAIVMVLIAVALLLVFGASRMPKIGTSLGQSLRAFKGALTGCMCWRTLKVAPLAG